MRGLGSIVVSAVVGVLAYGFVNCVSPPNLQQGGASSAATQSRSEIGFGSPKKLYDHFIKHGAEFRVRTQEQYLKLAQALRDAKSGGDILEGVKKDKVVTRYERKTGSFIAFDSDLTIRTFFKPNDGERYYWRQLNR